MTPRPLLLVGGGGLAREVLATARLAPEEWAPLGALDDDPTKHGQAVDGLPVLGGSELVHEHPDAAVVVCVASARRPLGRLALAKKLALGQDRFGTITHPGAHVAPGCVVGPGTVLLAGVVVTTPLRLGAHVVAMPHVIVTHDDEIGDGVTFAGGASLGGAVRVGESAYLGQRAAVREGLTIGAGAVVGMGAVVLTDVPAGEVWAGVPARRILREGNRT